MKCPRCQAVFSATADESGTVVCTSCGARLRSRTPAANSPPVDVPAADAESALAEALRQVLGEIRAVRKAQERILTLLQPRAQEGGEESDLPFSEPAPVRSRRRKSVLVIDDDAGTRQEAVNAFQAAEVPAHAVGDGHAAMSAIAAERPDVVVLELGMGGPMAGKDVVNVIKATMEWVDIPIVLYTRLPITSQKEARQIHGADELVTKGPNGVDALVSRVIGLFRKG